MTFEGGRPGAREGGPQRFREVLDERFERRATRRVPAVDPDPARIVVEAGVDPQRHRVTEALLTLSAGGIGTRGPARLLPLRLEGISCQGQDHTLEVRADGWTMERTPTGS